MNRPPLPPQSVTHPTHNNWDNVVRRTDSFSSVSSPPPQCYPNNMNHQKPFIDQVQASGITPIRRAVPMPGNHQQTLPPRQMSSSVFNLNQGGYPQSSFQQQQQQQQNPWGMNAMNQVSFCFSKLLCLI